MRGRFNSTPSLFAGRPTAQLQADLASAQDALIELQTGAKVVSASYAQGAGNRAVTYTPTDMPALISLIRQLQQQLGIVGRARQPIRPVF